MPDKPPKDALLHWQLPAYLLPTQIKPMSISSHVVHFIQSSEAPNGATTWINPSKFSLGKNDGSDKRWASWQWQWCRAALGTGLLK